MIYYRAVPSLKLITYKQLKQFYFASDLKIADIKKVNIATPTETKPRPYK